MGHYATQSVEYLEARVDELDELEERIQRVRDLINHKGAVSKWLIYRLLAEDE